MAELCMAGPAATQLAYHLYMAVRFAAADDLVECASETALACTILSAHGGLDAAASAEDLVDSVAMGATEGQWDVLRRRTEALALQLQAHFVSEGQHATATVYETAAATVSATLAALRDHRSPA